MSMPSRAQLRQADQALIDCLLGDLRAALERAADRGLDFRAGEQARPRRGVEPSPRRVVAITIESAIPPVFGEETTAAQCERQLLRAARG